MPERLISQAASKMPSRDRQNYVRRRLRFEYDQHRHETDPERIRFVLVCYYVEYALLGLHANG
jgi:hypothetical protein